MRFSLLGRLVRVRGLGQTRSDHSGRTRSDHEVGQTESDHTTSPTKSDEQVRLAQFNSYDARRFFSELVDRAYEGEEIVIARSGAPMAKLVPFRGDEGTRAGLTRLHLVIREGSPEHR
jgi:prevent-host-death family protein